MDYHPQFHLDHEHLHKYRKGATIVQQVMDGVYCYLELR